MNSRTILSTCVAVLVIAATALPAAADKTTATASFSGALSSGLISPIATATIDKGKAKRVLVVSATIAIEAFEPGIDLAAYVNANGVPLSGMLTTDQLRTSCVGDGVATPFGCTLSGTLYLDLDEAETLNPGLFKNQPINVILSAFAASAFYGGVDPLSGSATLVAQMVKK